MKNLVRNSFIALAVTCVIIVASIVLSSCLTSCAKVEKPTERYTFTVNTEKLYVDETQEVVLLFISNDSSAIELVTDIPLHVVYALLEEREELVLSNDNVNIYLYAEDNLR